MMDPWLRVCSKGACRDRCDKGGEEMVIEAELQEVCVCVCVRVCACACGSECECESAKPPHSLSLIFTATYN